MSVLAGALAVFGAWGWAGLFGGPAEWLVAFAVGVVVCSWLAKRASMAQPIRSRRHLPEYERVREEAERALRASGQTKLEVSLVSFAADWFWRRPCSEPAAVRR